MARKYCLSRGVRRSKCTRKKFSSRRFVTSSVASPDKMPAEIAAWRSLRTETCNPIAAFGNSSNSALTKEVKSEPLVSSRRDGFGDSQGPVFVSALTDSLARENGADESRFGLTNSSEQLINDVARLTLAQRSRLAKLVGFTMLELGHGNRAILPIAFHSLFLGEAVA